MSDVLTGVVDGVMLLWWCWWWLWWCKICWFVDAGDCDGWWCMPSDAKRGLVIKLGDADDEGGGICGGGLSWPTSKLAGGNPNSWDHWSLGQ